MTVYIAVDPGVVTGLVLWSDQCDLEEVYMHEIEGIKPAADLIKRWAMSISRRTILTEKFTISQRTIKGAVKYESLYLNGWLAIEYGDDVTEQTPAQAKGLVSDEMLHHLGWWHKEGAGHANDAARHLIYRLVKDRNPLVIDALKKFVA